MVVDPEDDPDEPELDPDEEEDADAATEDESAFFSAPVSFALFAPFFAAARLSVR
ncbi:MAG TPA: hypothetical protein VEL73_01330 [Mycobacteriales bacterium]|nr:hypothetical protein [Mycobacteriales bacterium]